MFRSRNGGKDVDTTAHTCACICVCERKRERAIHVGVGGGGICGGERRGRGERGVCVRAHAHVPAQCVSCMNIVFCRLIIVIALSASCHGEALRAPQETIETFSKLGVSS